MSIFIPIKIIKTDVAIKACAVQLKRVVHFVTQNKIVSDGIEPKVLRRRGRQEERDP